LCDGRYGGRTLVRRTLVRRPLRRLYSDLPGLFRSYGIRHVCTPAGLLAGVPTWPPQGRTPPPRRSSSVGGAAPAAGYHRGPGRHPQPDTARKWRRRRPPCSSDAALCGMYSAIRDVSGHRPPAGRLAACPDGYGPGARTHGPDRRRRPAHPEVISKRKVGTWVRTRCMLYWLYPPLLHRSTPDRSPALSGHVMRC
jgi:hypothetical protein